VDLYAIRIRCQTNLRVQDLYDYGFRGFADFGPDFRRVLSCAAGKDELLVTIRGEDAARRYGAGG
jgi:hypothetical protein